MKALPLFVCVALGMLAGEAAAAVRLPNIFGDNMVLQQEMAVPVWGWAKPGEKVTVEFAGQRKETVAGADGKWMVRLDALKASDKPQVFKVAGENAVTFSNVVVGEVWFCSGQSNMEFKVREAKNAEAEIAAANFPLIRNFQAEKRVASVPEDDVNAKWSVTAPDNIGNESAVAFFFGRDLHQALKVPVGLINCSWGGTRIEPWTPLCGFDGIPALDGIRARVLTAQPGSESHKAVLAKYEEALKKWIADADALTAAGKALVPPPAFPRDLILPAPDVQWKMQEPTVLFNGMVAGLVPFAIRGAVWYQGCSNNGEGMLYLEKTKALVKGWRQVWGQGDFPYYLVQLAPYTYGQPKNLPGIWEAQAAVPANIPNTGYTVINDVGNIHNIHPTDKQTVGRRLADQALARTYGRKGIAWSGPVYKAFALEGKSFRVSFDCAEGLKTRDGKAPDWFEVCGPDGHYYKADAAIDGQSVALTSARVEKPIAARFAWNEQAEPNLVNGAGLPAGAFRCGEKPTVDGAMAIPELKGFRKILSIDLPLAGNFGAAAPKYAFDETSKAGDFGRVGYLLQLQDKDGELSYVFCAMDAFTKEAKKLGIPSPDSGISFQQKVANLTVRSNVEGVPTLDNSDGGNIEFWPNNYGQRGKLRLPGGKDGDYDFDDEPMPPLAGYGCMQIHSWKDRVTLMAYNSFNGDGPCDVGIGNKKDGGNPDYTFAGNGGAYAVRRLTVFVK
jgi:sialate O-acetylesterase